MKVCSKCKETKILEDFCKDNSKPDGLYSSCKSCQREYRQNNKEKISVANRNWLSGNREKQNKYLRNWREENPTYYKDYYKENKEKTKLKSKKWRDENPEKLFNHSMKRRMNQCVEDINKEIWIRIMSSTNWKCFYCDEKLTEINRTIDHIIPINIGGSNKEENLAPCCLSCNCSKKDTLITCWYKFSELILEKKERLIKIEKEWRKNRK